MHNTRILYGDNIMISRPEPFYSWSYGTLTNYFLEEARKSAHYATYGDDPPLHRTISPSLFYVAIVSISE